MEYIGCELFTSWRPLLPPLHYSLSNENKEIKSSKRYFVLIFERINLQIYKFPNGGNYQCIGETQIRYSKTNPLGQFQQ